MKTTDLQLKKALAQLTKYRGKLGKPVIWACFTFLKVYKQRRQNSVLRRMSMNGKRVVVLEEVEFERLLQRADEWEPAMPKRDEQGLYPARETMAVIQARDIIRARRKLGLSQAALARLAGIRVETLNRIENAKNKPNVSTIEKIDRALTRAARRTSK